MTLQRLSARRSGGFTLIELLIVIAILMILMTALFPAVSKIQSRSKRLACAANLSNLYKAAIGYSMDHYDAMPKGGGKDILSKMVTYGLITDPTKVVCPASPEDIPPQITATSGQGSSGAGGQGTANEWDSNYELKANLVTQDDTNFSYSWTSESIRTGTDRDNYVLSADKTHFHDDGYNVLMAGGSVVWKKKGPQFDNLQGQASLTFP